MTSQPSSRRRVPAMAPQDRREALIAATVPLLRAHGLDVSTRQIAQAAGVAEGTIFGVFPNKGTLIHAAMLHALDPDDTITALGAIAPTLGLRDRLNAAADLINQRFTTNARLLSAARSLAMDSMSPLRIAENRERLINALTGLIAPHRAQLRLDPGTVSRALLLLLGANTYGPFGDPERFTGDEMVALLLDGLLVRATETTTTEVP